MISSTQVFQSKVSSEAEGFALPEIAMYVLNEEAARNILSIAQTVREKSLAVVEAHSTLVTYYAENGEALRMDNELPTKADCLCVTGDKVLVQGGADRDRCDDHHGIDRRFRARKALRVGSGQRGVP